VLRVSGWLVLLPRSSPFFDAEDRGNTPGPGTPVSSRIRAWSIFIERDAIQRRVRLDEPAMPLPRQQRNHLITRCGQMIKPRRQLSQRGRH